MDRTAFSLALGILAFVLSYLSFGMGWVFSLVLALGAMSAFQMAYQVSRHRNYAMAQDVKREKAVMRGKKTGMQGRSLEAVNA